MLSGSGNEHKRVFYATTAFSCCVTGLLFLRNSRLGRVHQDKVFGIVEVRLSRGRVSLQATASEHSGPLTPLPQGDTGNLLLTDLKRSLKVNVEYPVDRAYTSCSTVYLKVQYFV